MLADVDIKPDAAGHSRRLLRNAKTGPCGSTADRPAVFEGHATESTGMAVGVTLVDSTYKWEICFTYA